MDINQRAQNKETNSLKAHRPAMTSPNEVTAMLNRTEKETREQRARRDVTRNDP